MALALREVPEAMKPKNIAIGADKAQTLEGKSIESDTSASNDDQAAA